MTLGSNLDGGELVAEAVEADLCERRTLTARRGPQWHLEAEPEERKARLFEISPPHSPAVAGLSANRPARRGSGSGRASFGAAKSFESFDEGMGNKPLA